MFAGSAKTFAKIAILSLLFLTALAVIGVIVFSIISRFDREQVTYIDMNSGSVHDRRVKIAPGKYHMKRIHSTNTSKVEAKYVKGPEAELCIRKTSFVTPKKITREMCDHFGVLNKKSRNAVTFTLGRGNFDLFISNRATFSSAHVTYSVDVRP